MKCEIMTPIIHAFIIHLVNDDNVVCEQSYKNNTKFQDHKNYVYANQVLMFLE